jgi:hypothetical protein
MRVIVLPVLIRFLLGPFQWSQYFLSLHDFPAALLAALLLLVYYAPLGLAAVFNRPWLARVVFLYLVVNTICTVPFVVYLFAD